MAHHFRLHLLLATCFGFALAIPVAAQQPAASQTFVFEELPVNEGETTRIRDMLKGTTRTGYTLDMHVTELAPGQAPHAGHRHIHEEMLMLMEGELDVAIEGRTVRLGRGSAVFVASNDLHGWRNVGTSPARYFVLALGDDAPVPAEATGP
jgi:quercetin dioxygenase-like cupin family protein